MAGKKAKSEMPSAIPNLLMISGDIINPFKLLMDTAGQVVGKRTQNGSGNTKTEIQNDRTEATSCSSKHKIRTTKGATEKANRDQGSKAKFYTNKQKIEQLEDFSKIDIFENNPAFSKKKEARKLHKESQHKELKPNSTEKEEMQIPQTSRYILRKSETPANLPKTDNTLNMKTLEIINLKKSTSHNKIDKHDLSDNSESYLRPQISRYQKNARRKSEIPNLAVLHSNLENNTSAYSLRNKISDHEDQEGYEVKSAVERDHKRRRSVPSLIFDEPGKTNYISKALNKMAIGSLNASSTDLSENALRSGHQDMRTSVFSSTLLADESQLQLNMLNCPNNSTVQCFCGHINCPCCNLLMNLEITDPSILQ